MPTSVLYQTNYSPPSVFDGKYLLSTDATTTLLMKILYAILLTLLFGTPTSSILDAQVFDEDIRLSSVRTIPSIPTYALIQTSAINEDLELVVWGSSMASDSVPHPVLYFAIVDDSAIVVPPTRLTGLESRPGSRYDAFIYITPLTDRWLVSWIDGTFRENQTHAAVVDRDGTFGEPFVLWEDQRMTPHGISAVRMPTVDILCWSEAYRYDVTAGRLPNDAFGRRLPHGAYRPDSPVSKLGMFDVLLTREYHEQLGAGLIEISGGIFYAIQEDMTIARIETIPALSFGYDVFSLNEDYSLYVAHDDTLKHFRSFLDTMPIVTNIIEVESFWESRPISWFGVDKDGNLIASTFQLDNPSGNPQSGYQTYEKVWRLDTSLRVIGEERERAGYCHVNGLPPGVVLRLSLQSSYTERMPNNGSHRYFEIIEPRHEQSHSERYHLRRFVANEHGGFLIGSPEVGKSHLALLEEPYDMVPYSTVDRLSTDISIVYPRRNPYLHLKAGSMTRESATNERTPHLTILGDRIFASWLNLLHPTARHTVEIARDGTGTIIVGKERIDRDTAGGRREILGHGLISVGPHTISELHWRVGDRTHRELSLLREENGEVAWRPIYQESYTGDTGVSTTDRYYSDSFYDPDEQRAWIMSERYTYFSGVVPPQLSTRALQVSSTGEVIDTVDLYVPRDTNGRPYQSRLVRYYPLDSTSYLVKTRDHSLHVVDGVIIDTLTMMPGTLGKVTPDFDGNLLERRLYNASAVGISRHYPALDSTLEYGSSSAFRAESFEGETHVHPVDSTAMLLFGDRYSARLQSYDRLRQSYIFQDASSGGLPVLETSGYFSGDTLWVVMTVKEGETYRIHLNAVLPNVKTLSRPYEIDLRAIRRLWLR